jgi:hypothetical protein
MKRVIKFRGKCVISGDLVYGDLIHGVGSKNGNLYILPKKINLAYVKHCNNFCDDKLIVIVLTIAHLDNDTKNNSYGNLKALCQRCHNRYDVKFRKENRRNSYVKRLGLQSLFV